MYSTTFPVRRISNCWSSYARNCSNLIQPTPRVHVIGLWGIISKDSLCSCAGLSIKKACLSLPNLLIFLTPSDT